MPSKRIDEELAATGRWFEMANLPVTAGVVRSLIGKSLGHSAEWHAEVVGTYRKEIVTSLNILGEPDPAYHAELLGSLDGVLRPALSYPDQLSNLVLRCKATLERVGESHGNTREMYRSIAAGRESTKHTFLTVCLMYLILCEGTFGPQARFLLAVAAVGRNDAEPHVVLTERVKPSVLAERLVGGGLGAFQTGYHRHVRNAIAHGHFRFDVGTEHMRFRNYKPDSDDLVFEETWELEKMAGLFAKLDDAYLVNASYWQAYMIPAIVRRNQPTTPH